MSIDFSEGYADGRVSLATLYPWVVEFGHGGRGVADVRAALLHLGVLQGRAKAEYEHLPVTPIRAERDIARRELILTAGTFGMRVTKFLARKHPPEVARLIGNGFARAGVRVDSDELTRILNTIV